MVIIHSYDISIKVVNCELNLKTLIERLQMLCYRIIFWADGGHGEGGAGSQKHMGPLAS